MNAFLKSILLAIYALAIASYFLTLPNDLGPITRPVAAVLLIIHAVEVVAVFKYVRLYRGALAMSIVLTLLFGLLHWKPLADEARRGPLG